MIAKYQKLQYRYLLLKSLLISTPKTFLILTLYKTFKVFFLFKNYLKK